MDYDRNHFLTDIFEDLLDQMRRGNHRNPPTGDPVRFIDRAVENVIAAHVKELRAEAQSEREHLITMAEAKVKNPKDLARTLWASGENYDRRR